MFLPFLLGLPIRHVVARGPIGAYLYVLTYCGDWDVYYERGRKPEESILKYEATRSEGDYRRKVLLARIMRYRGEGRGVRG